MNECLENSQASYSIPPISLSLPPTSTCLFQPLPPTFTSASSGIRLRAAAFCWAFVFSASCVELKRQRLRQRNHNAYFLDFSWIFPFVIRFSLCLAAEHENKIWRKSYYARKRGWPSFSILRLLTYLLISVSRSPPHALFSSQSALSFYLALLFRLHGN